MNPLRLYCSPSTGEIRCLHDELERERTQREEERRKEQQEERERRCRESESQQEAWRESRPGRLNKQERAH